MERDSVLCLLFAARGWALLFKFELAHDQVEMGPSTFLAIIQRYQTPHIRARSIGS